MLFPNHLLGGYPYGPFLVGILRVATFLLLLFRLHQFVVIVTGWSRALPLQYPISLLCRASSCQFTYPVSCRISTEPLVFVQFIVVSVKAVLVVFKFFLPHFESVDEVSLDL